MPNGFPDPAQLRAPLPLCGPALAFFSPDSNYQVTLLKGEGETETVRIFSVNDLKKPLMTSEGTSLVTFVNFSLDSRFFTVTRNDGTIENYEFIESCQEKIVRLPSSSP
jgi:WD40 repeat protein